MASNFANFLVYYKSSDSVFRTFDYKNQVYKTIKKLSFETLFMYIAYQWKSYVSKKSIPIELKINPHPLDKYRTNVPLSRIPLFRAIYSVKKGDKMWWHSTNRIWEG